MPLRISLDLTDRDLMFFRNALQRSRRAMQHADEEEIFDAISMVIADIKQTGPLPDFINRRLPDIEALTIMFHDEEWQLPRADREQLLATFIYFGDPEDLIPDNIPGIGYLDDVIMIELLLREMCHVRDAYEDFCSFRRDYDGNDRDNRQVHIASRRKQLHARMRRRKAADKKLQKQASVW
ncbi:MAG: DUF1232 domain-containing protein [Gammaproteobacteria bacterium]|nr:DUF1232 domain-containing protein [Gammaproteobacteria bacterium]